MNTWHMCRDHETLMRWTDENRVPMPTSWDVMRGDYEGDKERVKVFLEPLEGDKHPRPKGL